MCPCPPAPFLSFLADSSAKSWLVKDNVFCLCLSLRYTDSVDLFIQTEQEETLINILQLSFVLNTTGEAECESVCVCVCVCVCVFYT